MRTDARRRLRPAQRSAALLLAAVLVALAGCQASGTAPLPRPAAVDLPAYMGDWYLLGGILPIAELDAHNAVETYRLEADGSIATTLRLRRGGFQGPLRVFHRTGFAEARSDNTVWTMRHSWLSRADYRILRLDRDPGVVVVGEEAREYVWIMAREPQLADDVWQGLLGFVAAAGYDPQRVRRVPQRWPE
ncbi:MAG TPA: lipocalin family protein [Pseudomonadales bacterium]|nr:lipocalin family protein [Pseudomonadales bacterium]